MMDRMGNLLHNRDKYASEATRIKRFGILFAGILFSILLMSEIAGATSVTYYLNATAGVNIGADGTTNVAGVNQNIPPIITALLDKTGNNSRGALTNDHPHELYNHSRWYFTTDYSVNTRINANPAGKVLIYASAGPYPNLSVRLYDYYPSNGSKTLIGSSQDILLSGGATYTSYSYAISSPVYIIPLNHRLMLQFDFDPKTHGNTNARIYANKINSYLTVDETPITYDVTINSTPSSANVSAGTNYTYNLTVNNTGTTDGNYSLSISDSDTTNFSSSVLGMTTLSVPAGGSNQTNITITANSTAQKDASDTTTITATSIENSIFTNITQITTNVSAPSFLDCAQCHESYMNSANRSKHNQTENPAAPTCTSCHTGYETQHTGFIVNESNTCRNCHIQNESGFYERHSSSSDCTSCHFANTTQVFSENASSFSHDHNLTVESNFYEYNQSEIPVRTNGGVGVGMFPYYTCTLTCHDYNATTGVEGKIDEAAKSWLESNHARSLRYPLSNDNKNNCAKCKSPVNYNESMKGTNPNVSAEDWQGIQCRVCHNLHDRKFPNNTGPSGMPIAFYNGTLSSLAGYAIYDKVNSSTELCEKCHNGGSHDSKFAGAHKDTAGFNCTNCHMNSSFNTELHKFEVMNTTSNVTGCEVCHNSANHTFQFTSRHTGKVDCVACHDQTVSRNATGYVVSPDNNYGIYKDLTTNEWTTYKVSHGAAASWPLHNVTKSVRCDKCHGSNGEPTLSVFSGQIAPVFGIGETGCAQCHATYVNAANNSMHNQTKNAAAPACTTCHVNYDTDSGHNGFIVNNVTTCKNCHANGQNGFYQRHTSSADCTQCHFANTTQTFNLNSSLFTHDHNLTVEHNFYEYNQSGMPVRTNGGVGVGMFPYYTCTLTCHKYNATTGVEGKIDEAASSWLESRHAQSLHMSGDNKMSCAKCKAPANFNASENQSSLISQPDWQGIQCRVCHNLHDRKFPNNTGPSGMPIAFYNSTLSSLGGYAIYEKVNSSTELCEKCHTGGSHDSKFEGTHKDTAGFNCTNCHMNSSFNNELHKFEVKNTTSSVTGCEVCHKSENHTFQYTSKHTGKVECVACHDQTISRNATGYAASPDNNYVICKDTVTNNWTTCKISHGLAISWPLHNISVEVNCDKCHGANLILPELSCTDCHASYGSALSLSKHNQTLNEGAPNCTMCHTGYEPVEGHTSGTKGYIVNESNTCRNCHIDGAGGFYERHSSSSDCTRCHFANTTQAFSLNSSLYIHDHNLTVEHNFYEYNLSGMPVRTNGGVGIGMFPYYTCTLTCHEYNATTGAEGKIDEAATSWLESRHAQSLHMSGDNKVSCAKCKAPANFNASANQSSLISQPDWQGIQCRVCHNLHDRKFPNNTGPGGFPVAFYNSTASFLAGYPVYEQVANATILCQNCHTGTSHDSKFAGTHKDTVNFTCTNCHMNSSFNNELHKFEVRNTTSGVTGCEVCHKASEHTVLLCKGKIDCVGCHDQTIQRNMTGYAVSPDNNYGIYKDNTTGNWTTYKVSKGSAVSWPLHNITLNVTCEKCHGTISVFSGLITQATGSFCERCHYQPPNGTGSPNTDGSHVLHKEKGYSAPETGCDYCHSTGGRNESGHPGEWDNADVVTNNSASIGIYVKNLTTGSDDTCGNVSCHTYNLSQGARVGYSTWNTSTAGLCNQCHSTDKSGVPPTGNHIKHSTQNVSCSTCHGNNSDEGKQTGHRNGQIEINLTNLASNGSFVSGTCTVYCHDPNPNDMNSSTPTWNTTKIVCGDCHTLPPRIFITRNGNSHPEDPLCDDCHGAGAGTGTHIKHRNGAVETFELRQCLSCHEINGSAIAKVDSASFGMHRDVNNTDGGITNSDCLVCHFNITGMFADYKPMPGINVYLCRDCHLNQTVKSTKVAQHIPGANLSVTTMNCEDCHVNSLNISDPRTTINSTLGKALHYGIMTNLVKPTAGTYNTACDICHNSSMNKTKYGVQNKQIYTPHTATAKCNMCHIPSGEADTLHNSSLSMPVVLCKDCHKTFASKYKAPNITGTRMEAYSSCNINWNCHKIDEFYGSMDTLARHNIDMTFAGTGGFADTVYLNNQLSLTIVKGEFVVITSRVNDTRIVGGASRVGGAEYYVDNDPGQGNGIPMNPTDGSFDALDDTWENVNAILNTSNLSNGDHNIFVRGVDIGGQWSAPQIATLTVRSLGYINISSNVPGSIVFINDASNNTDSNGNYSWEINFGTYNITVRKDPTYYANTSIGVVVTANNATNHNVVLALKPNGTISGTVMNG